MKMVIFSLALKCAYYALSSLCCSSLVTQLATGGQNNLQTVQMRLIEKWPAADTESSEVRKHEHPQKFAFLRDGATAPWGEGKGRLQTVPSWLVLGLTSGLKS
jgi:hypothetical protein